ncbi:MAG: response regulator, partial [Candidatus Thiodiazotropha sp.]
ASTLLRKKGANIIAVSSAFKALEVIRKQAFDLVLMDLEMPGMSGIEAARKIRSFHNSEKLPIIAVTAHILPQKQQDVFAAGMDDLLAKPYLPDQLYTIIRKWSGDHYDSAAATTVDSELGDESAVYNQHAALASVENDNNTADLILEEFLHMLPGSEAAMRDALANGDHSALYQAAHKLAGSASSSGASSIYIGAVTVKESLMQESADAADIEQRVKALLEETGKFKDYFASKTKTS